MTPIRLLLALVIGSILGACAWPMGDMPADHAIPSCTQYVVTTRYPGEPTIAGMPAIGCNDDSGAQITDCTTLVRPIGTLPSIPATELAVCSYFPGNL